MKNAERKKLQNRTWLYQCFGFGSRDTAGLLNINRVQTVSKWYKANEAIKDYTNALHIPSSICMLYEKKYGNIAYLDSYQQVALCDFHSGHPNHSKYRHILFTYAPLQNLFAFYKKYNKELPQLKIISIARKNIEQLTDKKKADFEKLYTEFFNLQNKVESIFPTFKNALLYSELSRKHALDTLDVDKVHRLYLQSLFSYSAADFLVLLNLLKNDIKDFLPLFNDFFELEENKHLSLMEQQEDPVYSFIKHTQEETTTPLDKERLGFWLINYNQIFPTLCALVSLIRFFEVTYKNIKSDLWKQQQNSSVIANEITKHIGSLDVFMFMLSRQQPSDKVTSGQMSVQAFNNAVTISTYKVGKNFDTDKKEIDLVSSNKYQTSAKFSYGRLGTTNAGEQLPPANTRPDIYINDALTKATPNYAPAIEVWNNITGCVSVTDTAYILGILSEWIRDTADANDNLPEDQQKGYTFDIDYRAYRKSQGITNTSYRYEYRTGKVSNRNKNDLLIWDKVLSMLRCTAVFVDNSKQLNGNGYGTLVDAFVMPGENNDYTLRIYFSKEFVEHTRQMFLTLPDYSFIKRNSRAIPLFLYVVMHHNLMDTAARQDNPNGNKLFKVKTLLEFLEVKQIEVTSNGRTYLEIDRAYYSKTGKNYLIDLLENNLNTAFYDADNKPTWHYCNNSIDLISKTYEPIEKAKACKDLDTFLDSYVYIEWVDSIKSRLTEKYRQRLCYIEREQNAKERALANQRLKEQRAAAKRKAAEQA